MFYDLKDIVDLTGVVVKPRTLAERSPIQASAGLPLLWTIEMGIPTPWPFRYPQPVKMSISIASSPRLSGTGMTSLNP